jgi:beta-lactamase class A
MGWGSLATTQTKTTVPSASLSESLPLLNPSAVAGWDKYFIINFKPLKEKFKEIQSEYPEKTYIYFDYLNSASWVGLNEKELFTAASTIKVPLAMAIYKLVEEGKIRLDEAYTLDELDLDDHFGTLYKIGAGRELTVQTLIEIMLEQSDNTAMQALISVAQKAGLENPFDDVYGAMGWDATNFGEAPRYEEINLKTLSTMFLALYNAKYLDPEHSQMILSYLTTSPFNEKIVAGVPQGIPIAHKMGSLGGMSSMDEQMLRFQRRPSRKMLPLKWRWNYSRREKRKKVKYTQAGDIACLCVFNLFSLFAPRVIPPPFQG